MNGSLNNRSASILQGPVPETAQKGMWRFIARIGYIGSADKKSAIKTSKAVFLASDVGAAWRGTLSRSVARVDFPNLRLVVQDHVQQRAADF